MTTRRRLLGSLVILLLAVIGATWVLAIDLPLGWAHLLGLVATLALLVVIWLWPGRQEPTEPPP
jgi:hypothetical protein